MIVAASRREQIRLQMGWKCSVCGGLITSIEDGWVEWLVGEDEQGNSVVRGLRLVHRLQKNRAKGKRAPCRYDFGREFQKDHSIVEGLPLARFVGVDGLMLLLSLLAIGEIPKDDVLELAKRVQIPGYEQARELFPEAVEHGLASPVIADRYYLQSEIRFLLNWSQRELR